MDNDFWDILDVLMGREWQNNLQAAFGPEPEEDIENEAIDFIVRGTPSTNSRSLNSVSGPSNSNDIGSSSTKSSLTSVRTRNSLLQTVGNAQYKEAYYRERALRIKAEQRALIAEQRALVEKQRAFAAEQRALVAEQKNQEMKNELTEARTVIKRQHGILQQYETLAKDMLLHGKYNSTGGLPARRSDQAFDAIRLPRSSGLLESSKNAERFLEGRLNGIFGH
ncbi:hypothetical protein MP638_003341 [Amoeboaphelidium occidentale]|nr:hypothetical protein MP638_003243 [Amoeboaphelidium occidentale]KAI3659521.1 hypothetical protein MP638_003341 [Amoeboaphelidium occidentale]